MKYYFNRPNIKLEATKDYVILYEQIVRGKDVPSPIREEFNFFILESCRFYVDKKEYDKEEVDMYYELVNSAYYNLLIHREKIEKYFKEYINALFTKKKIEREKPANLSEVVIDLMLSELDMNSILQHVNLGTQEVDIQSIKDTVKLEKINNAKKIHDTVLFFIEIYNKHEL